MPLYPQSVANQKMCLDFLLFCYFHFKFSLKFIKGFRNVSDNVNIELCAYVHIKIVMQVLHLVLPHIMWIKVLMWELYLVHY
jgi:hypothetical protein